MLHPTQLPRCDALRSQACYRRHTKPDTHTATLPQPCTTLTISAQMDATENDIPPQAGFRVSGFPTIKFRAAGTDEWVDYNGDRSLESLVEFIEENRASEPSGDIDPMAGISKEEVEDVDVEEGDVERDVQEEKALHVEL